MAQSPVSSVETDAIYSYQSLSSEEIRVLILTPGKPEDELHAKLEILSLDDFPEYRAVSYAWGEPLLTERILLPKGTLHITKSLHSGLCRFRSEIETVRLWVDQVCIDQANVPEKNSQVAMMDTIYAKAIEVLVWLGSAQPDDCLALWMLNFLYDFHKQSTDRYGNFDETAVANILESFQQYKTTNTICLQCSPGNNHLACEGVSLEHGLTALAHFWTRAWFKRLWILQECLLANFVKFIWGNHETSLSVVGDAVTMHQRYQNQYFGVVGISRWERDEVWRVFTMFKETAEGSRLLFLLVRNHARLCTDSRDRVFAIRALANIGHVRELEPDYSASLEDIWHRTAVYLISGGSNFERYDGNRWSPCPSIILALPALQQNRTSSDEPSWVPDFGELDVEGAIKYDYYFYCRKFCAGGPSRFQAAFDEGKPGILRVSGQFICAVRSTQSGSQYDPFISSSDHEYWEAVRTRLVPWYVRCRQFALDTQGALSFENDEFKIFLYQGRMPEIDERMRVPDFEECRDVLREGLKATWTHKFATVDPQQTYADLKNLLIYNAPQWEMDTKRVLATTTDSRLGWVPGTARAGDRICLLKGAKCPFVLRSRDDGFYTVIGDSYIHGIMHGEAWSTIERETEVIELK